MTSLARQPAFSAEAIRTELARVLASSEFTASRHLTNFLKFIVEEALAGREDRLKERTIAVGALHRDADFDSRLDCIVRVVAGKLRRALERYYATRGASNPLCIAVPAGSYAPVFRRTVSPSAAECGQPAAVPPLHRDAFGRPAVVVVPFLSFTAGAEERFVADLLAEDLAVRLSQFSWLDVVDALSTRSAGVEPEDPRAVAARLGADFVLAGTVGRIGSHVRLTVRLIDVLSGVLAWAEQFDCQLGEERLSQHDRTVDRIVTRVGDLFGALTSAARSHIPKGRGGAFTAFQAVLASFQYQCRLDNATFPHVLLAVERAVLENPEFAWGWAALATLHLDLMCSIAKGGSPNESQQALAYSKRALILDPSCSYAHFTLGLHQLFTGRIAEAAESAERALELALGSPFEVGAAGALLSLVGEPERGRQLAFRALQVNPRLPGWIHWGIALGYTSEGDARGALAATERFTLPDCFVDPLIRAAALAEAGDVPAARAALNQAARLQPDLESRSHKLVSMLVVQPEVRERVFDNLREAGLRSSATREPGRPSTATNVRL